MSVAQLSLVDENSEWRLTHPSDSVLSGAQIVLCAISALMKDRCLFFYFLDYVGLQRDTLLFLLNIKGKLWSI